jgi:hypothetical protein
MKVEDVPEEWVALGIKAHELYSPLLVAPMPTRVPSREEMWEAQVRWIIAAVAPAIRRAALEEAAEGLEVIAKEYRAEPDAKLVAETAATEDVVLMVFNEAAAAIRALYA